MKELYEHIKDEAYETSTIDDLKDVVKRNLITNIAKASFHDVFPSTITEDIFDFARASLLKESTSICVVIKTKDGGNMSFLYPVETTPSGVLIHPATQIYIPKRSSSTVIPTEMKAVPRLELDVSE